MRYNYTTTPENGPTLNLKAVVFAKEERIGNEFKKFLDSLVKKERYRI